MPYLKAKTNNVSSFVLIILLMVIKNTAYSNDLLEVYSQAKQNNIQLQSSLTDYKIIQEQRNEIASEYDPSLSLNIQPGYNFAEKRGSNRAGIDYSFSLKKPIYQQQLNARISQADTTIHKQQVAFNYEKQQLIAQVTKAYLGFVTSQNRLALSLSEQALIRGELRQTESLFKSQLATITDVSSAQLRLEQSSFAVSMANLELNDARKVLHILSGVSFSSLAGLDLSQPLPTLQPSQLGGWIKLANTHSHELLLARLDLHIQKKGIHIEKKADSTSVDLFASYKGESSLGSETDLQDDRGGKVGFELNIPLYSGDRNASKIRSANLQYQKTQYALNLKRREIAQNIQLEYLTVKAGIQNMRTLQNTVRRSEETLSSIKRGQAAGIRTMADVLSYSQESMAVKRNFVEAKYKLLIDFVNLRLSAGVLSVNDLMVINALFTRRQHSTTVQTHISTIERSFEEAESSGVTLEDAWNSN